MSLLDYCSRKPITTDRDATVLATLQQMDAEGVGCMVITRDGRPIGIVTDRDLGLSVLMRKLDPRAVRVGELMHEPLETLPANASLELAFSRVRTSRLRRLPVVDDDGQLAGILSLDDLVRLVATEIGDLAEAVRRQLSHGPSALQAISGGTRR
jgi:CBS domain-containing protein